MTPESIKVGGRYRCFTGVLRIVTAIQPSSRYPSGRRVDFTIPEDREFHTGYGTADLAIFADNTVEEVPRETG